MIVHVSHRVQGKPLYWAECTFAEKDTVKAAGFIWHGGDRCKPNCGACAAGLGKVWWTYHADAARRVGDQADPDARTSLGLDADRVETNCGPLHDAMLAALAREKIIPPLDLERLRRQHRASAYTFNASLAKALGERPLQATALARLRALDAPDDGVKDALYSQWDGEDELFDVVDLRGLEHCVALEELRLDLLDVKSLGPLGKLPKLRRLSLDFRGKTPSLQPLAKLEQLEELWVSWATDLAPLRGLPMLAKLEVVQASDRDLSPLAELPALKHVRIWWSAGAVDEPQVKARNAKVLKQLAARKVKVKLG